MDLPKSGSQGPVLQGVNPLAGFESVVTHQLLGTFITVPGTTISSVLVLEEVFRYFSILLPGHTMDEQWDKAKNRGSGHDHELMDSNIHINCNHILHTNQSQNSYMKQSVLSGCYTCGFLCN